MKCGTLRVDDCAQNGAGRFVMSEVGEPVTWVTETTTTTTADWYAQGD